MSKELTPLKALNDLIDYLESEHLDLSKEDHVVERKEIIETALEDYEMEHTLRIRLENANYELVREKQENENKLKALEIIKKKEEELGIDLVTFIKIFENGIYVKSQCTNNKIERWSPFDIKVIKSTYQTDICYIRSKKNKYVGCFNYGKTWALTKEELELKQ